MPATLSPPAQLPASIRRKLGSARARLRSVDLGLGLARGVLVVGAGLLLLFALDVTLEPPLEVIRAFALFVGIVAGMTSVYWTTRPLRRSLSDDDVALMLEGHFPELQGGLVSSVQLLRESDHHTSQALIQRTVDRAARKVDDVDVGEIVRLGPLIPLWLLIGAFIVFSGGIANSKVVRPYVGIFAQRVLKGQDVRYPKRVGFEVALERKVRLAKGDDLDVVVNVTKGASVLERLTILTRYADGREEQRELLRKGELVFAKAYQNVTEAFAFRVEAPEHGVSSPIYEVEVVQRPRIEQYEFLLRYPDYVGREPERLNQPDLTVPAGTEISYAAVSNKALVTAELIFEQKPERRPDQRGKLPWEARPGPAPTYYADLPQGALAEGGAWSELAGVEQRLELSAGLHGKRALFGRFAVKEDLRFRFQLTSEDALETGKKPVAFSVRVVRDKRPIVSIPVPGGMKQVTPQAKVDLRVDAKDDYGLAHVELRMQPVKEDGTEGEWTKRDLPLPEDVSSPRKVRLPYTISLADFRLQPGDQLVYQAAAFDHNLDTKSNHDLSRRYALQIVRPEDLERMLQDRMTALKERLSGVGREQTDARKASQEFVRDMGPKGVLTEDDKRRLQRLEYDQRRVTTRLNEVEKSLGELLEEREANRLTDPSAMSLLNELREGVKKLADEKSPSITRQLKDTRTATKLDSKTRAAMARVPDLQDELADELQRLATRIDKYGDFTEVLQELRDLLSGQDRVIDGAGEAAKAGAR
ncbi:MAG TPA: hypothetical protein DEA08_02155 [Planctomycetes bacterium]|nr:hypothetical protein [Planctomycetota bacterium]